MSAHSIGENTFFRFARSIGLPFGPLAVETRALSRRVLLLFGSVFYLAVLLVPSHAASKVQESDSSSARTSQISPHAGAPKIGKARICASREEPMFVGYNRIVIPATALFRATESKAKTIGDPTSRATQRTPSHTLPPAALVTIAPVVLTKASRCAVVGVKVYPASGHDIKIAVAGDRHIYDLNDVLEYTIPEVKPPIEVGKLIDDALISAALIEDASKMFVDQRPQTSAPSCVEGGSAVAAFLGVKLARRSGTVIAFEPAFGATEISYKCAAQHNRGPALTVAWNYARPSLAITSILAKAGELVIGAGAEEIAQELSACVNEALKPHSQELATREFRGAKIDCQAFQRDGGGGIATLYRRFGSYP